jgi:acyl-[acyl-carrier-protein] desaturase
VGVVRDLELLAELAPVARTLVDRHLSNAREWFPHELVPWSEGRDFDPSEVWSADASPIDEAVRSALFVNLLTEDNLPYYYWTIDRSFGGSSLDGGDVWSEWTRRWTAEEGRHSIVIRDYLTIMRLIDPVALERGRMTQMSGGMVPQFESSAEGLAYVALQELATQVSHTNTSRLMPDKFGKRIMARVAGDENLHHVLYRDLVIALLEAHPDVAVIAIDKVAREFEMPGTGIPGFSKHARAIASAGIYDFAVHHDSILEPMVIGAWQLDRLEGLSGEAEEARVRCLDHLERVGRIGRQRAKKRD